MKNNWKSNVLIQPVGIRFFLLLLFLALSACNRKNEHARHDEYTCPMHPAVIQDKPGSCPICGMDLVLKGRPGDQVKITPELDYLLKPTNAVVVSSIRTVMPVQQSLNIKTKTNGLITYDTRRTVSVPIRFGGRIEKLLVKFNFQPVRKGQKILEIYSPELVTTQRELLYLLTSDKENAQVIFNTKEKLKLLGVSDVQIDHLVSSGQETYSFSVFSPVDGYITEGGAEPASPLKSTENSQDVSMGAGMANSDASDIGLPSDVSSSEIRLREGMYVSKGQVIFNVVNTQHIWAEFNIYQKDASLVHVNDPVRISVDNLKDTIDARVSLIQPFFKNGESFVTVRVYLPNSGNKLKIGQLVTGELSAESSNSIWIPLSARLDVGSKIIAFVKRMGVFRPKAIGTGRESGDWIEVTEGLETNDSLAYNAQFMVDSESFIKVRN